MNLDIGTIVVVVAVLLFYLRLILLQREKARRLRDLQTIIPKAKKGQAAPPRAPATDVMKMRFRSVALTVVAFLLMLAGVALAAIPGLSASLRQLWWVAVTLGVILLGVMIR